MSPYSGVPGLVYAPELPIEAETFFMTLKFSKMPVAFLPQLFITLPNIPVYLLVEQKFKIQISSTDKKSVRLFGCPSRANKIFPKSQTRNAPSLLTVITEIASVSHEIEGYKYCVLFLFKCKAKKGLKSEELWTTTVVTPGRASSVND